MKKKQVPAHVGRDLFFGALLCSSMVWKLQDRSSRPAPERIDRELIRLCGNPLYQSFGIVVCCRQNCGNCTKCIKNKKSWKNINFLLTRPENAGIIAFVRQTEHPERSPERTGREWTFRTLPKINSKSCWQKRHKVIKYHSLSRKTAAHSSLKTEQWNTYNTRTF